LKNILAIANKELRVYFTSPMAYVVIAMFLLVNGYLFYNIVIFAVNQGMQMMQFRQSLPQINVNEMIFRPVFHNMAIIMILTLPMLTMRLLAEEKKAKTSELLMTSPVTLNQIILGKYLATLFIFATMLFISGFMPVILDFFGDLKWIPVLTGYLGMLLLGGVFLSIGLLASSLTENQVIAGFVGFGLILLIWLMGWMAQADTGSPVSSVIGYLSVGEHFDNFVKGLIDTGDLIYMLSLITVGLFFTHRVLESQRWK
jgi:gliding motility-associated transport system permease protein